MYIQMEYNRVHGITPKTIIKKVVNTIEITKKATKTEKRDKKDILREIEQLSAMMKIAATSLDFETAIALRDQINALKQMV